MCIKKFQFKKQIIILIIWFSFFSASKSELSFSEFKVVHNFEKPLENAFKPKDTPRQRSKVKTYFTKYFNHQFLYDHFYYNYTFLLGII